MGRNGLDAPRSTADQALGMFGFIANCFYRWIQHKCGRPWVKRRGVRWRKAYPGSTHRDATVSRGMWSFRRWEIRTHKIIEYHIEIAKPNTMVYSTNMDLEPSLTSTGMFNTAYWIGRAIRGAKVSQSSLRRTSLCLPDSSPTHSPGEGYRNTQSRRQASGGVSVPNGWSEQLPQEIHQTVFLSTKDEAKAHMTSG